jgi:hypothetical protein
MAESRRLPCPPAMFAACMLFQVIYAACVVLWLVAPDLRGHAPLIYPLPSFEFLDVLNFICGLLPAAVYGWFVAVVFVFSYDMRPKIEVALFGRGNARTAAMEP